MEANDMPDEFARLEDSFQPTRQFGLIRVGNHCENYSHFRRDLHLSDFRSSSVLSGREIHKTQVAQLGRWPSEHTCVEESSTTPTLTPALALPGVLFNIRRAFRRSAVESRYLRAKLRIFLTRNGRCENLKRLKD